MREQHLSDYILVQKALKGDRHAFEEIIKKHELLVSKTVIGFLGNSRQAEDVGQEVFIRFFRSMNQYKGDSALGTYLTRIAINLSLNELKRLKTKNMQALENNISAVYADNEMEKREIVDIVNRALQQLEPDFRSVVILRMIDGYSTKETAAILGLPQGTVLSRLARAHKKLKVILKNEKIFGK